VTTPGYAGRILHVNLTGGTSRIEPLDSGTTAALIGGYGIKNRLAFELLPAGVDPLSPENLIILGAGPFAGTMVPGAAKVLATTRFPMNGTYATAAGGGAFALFLKSAGYDHVVISGRAPGPVYLKLTEGGAELVDATGLWRRDTHETDDALRGLHEPCSIIATGPAGENLVKNSIALVDKAGTIGRGGLAAVMGSKNLKAIVVERGTVPTTVADRLALHRLVNRLHERIMRWPGTQQIHDNGLMAPPPDMAEAHQRTRAPLACPSCPLADKVMVCLGDGPYAGLRTYMTHLAVNRFSAGSSQEAYWQSVKYQDAVNKYGIGSTNFTSLFGELVDLYEQGIITSKTTGGLELRNDIETALELLRLTAHREGFGALLAEGAEAVVQHIGEGAETRIGHIKGLSVVRDPRIGGLGTMEFEQMTSPRGAHVAAAGSPSYDPGRSLTDFIRHAERMGASQKALSHLEETGKFNPGRYSRLSEDWYSLFNCLSLCNRAQVNRFYHVRTIADLLRAVTGLERSPEQLMEASERAWTVGKLLNVREGFDRRQDRPPEAWFEPLLRGGEEQRIHDYEGTTELTRDDLERLLDDYYDERSYDIRTGLPTRAKLRQLGLEDMATGLDLPEGP
jgi:aldehyde:ferredoxin oxidoreductase